ncbi:hypothetical protein GH146_01195, partial [archaeon]|nr:hypothetical protein [archaeon]
MVKKEKDDFLAAQGLAAANCLIRVECYGLRVTSYEFRVHYILSGTSMPSNPMH